MYFMDSNLSDLRKKLTQKYNLPKMPRVIKTERYLEEITSFKERYPENQMTLETLSIINVSFINHSLEETMRTLNPELYTIYACNRILVLSTLNRLENIYWYHRYHMHKAYERTRGYSPTDYFLKALEKPRTHQT